LIAVSGALPTRLEDYWAARFQAMASPCEVLVDVCAGAPIDAEPVVTATDSKGYAVTEHVRRYYRTMKV